METSLRNNLVLLKSASMAIVFLAAEAMLANPPNGGNGTGPNVTLSTNSSAGTITMANGIVTAVISIYSSQILQLTYNGQQVTDGGTAGNGAFYWQGSDQTGAEQTGGYGILSVVVNPATNGGDDAEICIANLYASQDDTNAYAADAYYYFDMFRGSPGIYVTEDMERTTNAPAGGGGVPSLTCKLWTNFNWLAQDTGRNLLRESAADADDAISGINNAPKEVTLLQTGQLAGQFECKYDFSGDLGLLHFAGWCSTDLTTNFGLWLIRPSSEFNACGPKHPEIIGQIDMINCPFAGVHFGFGSDLEFTNGETWSHVCGPLFFYFNQVPPGTANPQVPLYADAAAQAVAEEGAWPYNWFTDDTNYAQAAGRGAVSGKLLIADSGNPNASAAGMWVGVLQQPASSIVPPTTDFQYFAKNYQFWVQTDTNGNFVISNVVAGSNYTLLSFGPGAIGLYQSQSFGAAPPVQLYIPPTPFAITVNGGQTNNLGNVTWRPTRVGATVWEMGVPDRDTTEFRHGADYFHGDLGNATNLPVNWAQWQEYNLDYPSGVNFTVGQSRWSADWDYAQPTSLDPTTGNLNGTTQNIFFDLANTPASSSQASIYFAIVGDYAGPVIVTVNGVNVTSPSTGFFPYYSSDPMIRMESHGIFCDYRLNFAGNLLNLGQNEIQLNMRKGGYFSDSILYDYIRLELTGYIPPTPAGLTAIPGNGLVLLNWPVSSGATSYTVLRSPSSGSGYTAIATNVIGPVVGSDVPDAVYADTAVVNGTTYYYVVQAVNPNGASLDSPQATAAPSTSTPDAPAAPTGLTVVPGNLQATLSWNPSPGAATYTIRRTVITGGAVANDPGAAVVTQPDGNPPINVVNSFVTTTNYTDTGLANNVTYAYTLSAANANGQSANSVSVSATPSPVLPVPPTGLAATLSSNLVNLSWNPVSNASSYVLQRATSMAGPYTTLDYPAWLSIFTDGPLAYDTTYYYEVASANLAGISSNSAPLAVTLGPAPPGLTAVPGNGQISLNWTATPSATNYVLERSTSSNGSFVTILSTTNTSYVNTGLVNGDTYYYLVYAVGPYGASPLSAQASATPFVGATGNYWINTITTSPQSWNANSNWSYGTAFPNSTQALAIVNTAISAGQTIELNQAITIGELNMGASSGAAAFNITGNGGTLTLDNTPGQALLLQSATSKGDTISATMTVNGSLLVTNGSTNTLTLAGNISGATNGVTVDGNVTLSGTNIYTNGTTLNSGSLIFSASSAIPASGALTLNNAASVTVTPANSLPSVLVNGTNSITGNGNSGTGIATLNDQGTLVLFVSGGSAVFDLTGVMSGPGNLVLGSSPMTLRFNGTAGDGSAIFNLGTGTAVANVRRTETTAIALGGLTGGSGTQLQGDNSSGGDNVTYTIGGANANTEFDGVIANGSIGVTAMIKIGTGALTLTGANTYSGGTTINGGLLQVNNLTGSGAGSGAVTVANGGKLGGDGIISGAVTVNSGGALVPGNPFGTLTISNNLTLNSGSTVFVQVEPSPLTNGAVKISGALNEGGTLIVTNISATPFTAGDTFKLLSAANYGGSFGSFVLPPLTGNLAWNTNALTMAGTLSVVALTRPTFSAFGIVAGNLVLSGSGGISGWPFLLLASTNLAAAPWTPVATNQFDANGNFMLTNTVNQNSPQTFYKLEYQ